MKSLELELIKIEQEKKKTKEFTEQIKKDLDENSTLKLINEKLKEKEKLYKKLLEDYEFPPSKPILIGLNNIGATCFMNATLQCLSQTKGLTNYFLNEKNKDRIINNNYQLKNPNDLQLSPSYLELIQNLWDKNGNESYSPYNFRKIVEQMNPLFKEGQAGDSKDFIIFILERLHKELKQPINNNNITPSEPLNQYDKANTLNNFWNDFQQNFSIISDIFYGVTEITNECIYCKNNYNLHGFTNNPIVYNYQIFNCLIFPLEEVKNMKNSSMINNNNILIQNNNRVNLYECFYYYQKSVLFSGDNRNYCNNCNQLSDSIYTNKIYSGPNSLILILNRGRGNIYDVKLDFTENIDITDYILQKDNTKIIYSLYGVITHIGQSGPSAHFVASCKSSKDNNWYRFNDAFINPINNIQKDIIEFGTPYILFYQLNNN